MALHFFNFDCTICTTSTAISDDPSPPPPPPTLRATERQGDSTSSLSKTLLTAAVSPPFFISSAVTGPGTSSFSWRYKNWSSANGESAKTGHTAVVVAAAAIVDVVDGAVEISRKKKEVVVEMAWQKGILT